MFPNENGRLENNGGLPCLNQFQLLVEDFLFVCFINCEIRTIM